MGDKKKTCFIIMPISVSEPFLDDYRDGVAHFKHVLECLFIPSVESAGYEAILPLAKGSDLIHAEIIKNLERADLVLCDMSGLNPNVFFEFGIRTSLNKPVCVVKDELTEKVPFDTGILNYQGYRETLEPWELPEEIKKLAEHLKAAEERSKGQNTLWKYFGLRAEARPYVGEAGAESKIDYLTLQMDSLRQQVSSIQQHPEVSTAKPEPLISAEIRDAIISSVLELLPAGVRLRKANGNLERGFTMHYDGSLDPELRTTIRHLIWNQYDTKLTLIGTKQSENIGYGALDTTPHPERS